MAKRKKTKQPVKASDDFVVENGVTVSRTGKDRGSEHLWAGNRAESEELVLQEIQAAANAPRARIARRRGYLEVLHEKGLIDNRTLSAGRAYQDDYFNAQLEPYPPPTFESKSRGSGDNLPGARTTAARIRLKQAMRLVGASGQHVRRVIEDLIGKEKPIGIAYGIDRSTKSHVEQWTITGLSALADFYCPQKK